MNQEKPAPQPISRASENRRFLRRGCENRVIGADQIRVKAKMESQSRAIRTTWMILATSVIAVAGCNSDFTNKENTDWYHARARILYGVAIEQFDAGQLDHARNKAQESLSLDPQYTPAQLLLGKVYIEQDHYPQAVGVLSELHKNLPDSAEVLYLLGVAQERCGNLSEALASYRRAYALDTTDISPVMAAAEVLVSLGRLRESQLYVESYLAIAGTEPGMYELAGRLASMRNEHDKSAKFYEQAHDLDYKNLRYLEAMGRAQFFAEKYDDAADTFRNLIDEPEYKTPSWVYTMLGDSCMALGRPYKARDAYQHASDLDPSSAGVWVNLAKAALVSRDEPRAIVSARQGLQLSPTQLDAMLVLGYALIRSGQIERAIRFLTEAIPVHPENATLRCLLGRAFAAAGNESQAAQCYSDALQLEPSSNLARELLAGAYPHRTGG